MIPDDTPLRHADADAALGAGLDWPMEAAITALRPQVSPPLTRGVPGCLFRSRTVPAIYAELDSLCLPTLRDLGIDAAISDPETFLATFAQVGAIGDRDRQRKRSEAPFVAVYRFAGRPSAIDSGWRESEPNESIEAATEEAGEDRRRTVLCAGRVREAGPERILWEDRSGAAHMESHAAFRERFTHVARIVDGGRAEPRRKVLTAAILRATLFALAFPDRFLTDAETDAPARAEACEFLSLAAGSRRDPISLRWRRAGELLAEARVSAALGRLYDAGLRGFGLPPALFDALSDDRGGRLSDTQRRELIYLARAGHRDLKVAACSRLAGERNVSGVRATLLQLAAAPDALVRNAAAWALADWNVP